MSRTYPTFLDVLVAFFGGVAGIVSNSRFEKTTAIPGVAIATALMPPLCAAGYGLAKLEIAIFLGAFYLFFINAVFISISTFLIVKYLEFPLHVEPDERTQRTVTRVMTFFLIIVIAPSIYFLYTIWYRSQIIQQINQLLDEVTQTITIASEREVLNIEKPKTAEEVAKVKRIKMYVSGEEVGDSVVQYYAIKFKEIGDYNFTISTLNNVSQEDIKKLSYSVTQENVLELRTRLEMLTSQVDTMQSAVFQAEGQRVERRSNQQILEELSIFFAGLELVEISDTRSSEERGAAYARKLDQGSKTASTKKLWSDSLHFDLAVGKQSSFPYLQIAHRVVPVHRGANPDWNKRRGNIWPLNVVKQSDFPFFKVAINADSTRLSDESLLAVVPQPGFPYFNLKPRKEALMIYHAEPVGQMPSSRDGVEEVSRQPRTKRIIEVALIWQREVALRQLSNQDKERIYEYLNLKLHPDPDEDSLLIRNFVSEEAFVFTPTNQ
ncbi:MAG: DUF389 domain-containing protein [Bacteroidia bacterium]|nr:DUF389 domain-containing protein [Bacteroidia bacterium]